MAISGKGFQRKSKAADTIPSSSLADIAFLLLIFFMVTTVFRKEQERNIEWPDAAATQQIDEKRQNIMYIWVEQTGQVYMNDRPIAMSDIPALVAPAWLESNRRLVISLRADARAPYRYVHQVTEEIKNAGAMYVVFATDLERQMQRVRR